MSEAVFMWHDWLAARLMCEGRVIRPALDPSKLTNEDLPDICLRMHLILDSIEFSRCEGRMINLDVFEPIDTLYSDLLHKDECDLSDWKDSIERFGDYYQLSGRSEVEVSSRAVVSQFHLFEELKVKLASE